jgi:hypothetical protein
MYWGWLWNYFIDPLPDFRLLNPDGYELGFLPVLKVSIL